MQTTHTESFQNPIFIYIKKYCLLYLRNNTNSLSIIIIVNKMDEFSNKNINKCHTTVPVYFVTPIICLLCKYSTQNIRGNMSGVDNHWHCAILCLVFLSFHDIIWSPPLPTAQNNTVEQTKQVATTSGDSDCKDGSVDVRIPSSSF